MPAEGWLAIYKVPELTDLQKAIFETFIAADKSKTLEWLSPRQPQAFRTANQSADAGSNKQ